jgi:signal transduction histidine kinase/CheY-like chemotaxis protein
MTPPTRPHEADAALQPLLAQEKVAALRRHLGLRLAVFAVAGLCCLPLLATGHPWRAAAWAFAMAIPAGLMGTLMYRLRKAAPERAAAVDVRLGTACAVASGLAWSAGWLLLGPGAAAEDQAAFGLAAAAALLPAVASHAPHRPALQGLLLAALLPPLLWGAWPANAVAWPVPAALAAVLLVALYFAREASCAFEAVARARLQDEELRAQLAAERDAAVAANLAKSRFITSASHDLRQPMHALSIQLESLDIPGVPASARVALTRVRHSVGNLNQMFESLLDMSRLDGTGHRAGDRLFRLPDFAAGLAEVAAPLAARKGIGFRVEGLEGAVSGDEKLLRQVALNLLSNAVAYTSEGEVTLRLLDDGGCLTLEVADTGWGISPPDTQRIFTEFFRAEHTRSQHDGLGLGLSIVRRVCELVGAQIEVTSELGHGSTFRVKTPYRVQRSTSFADAAPAPPGGIPSLHGKWVAVIEDDPHIVEAYRDAFTRRGAHVVVLPEKIDLLDRELAHLSQLDLIVSDYRLRDTTGDLLIERLRESFNDDIPAVVVTADTAPAHAERFRRMGVELLHKPLAFRTLLATAEALLLRRAEADAAAEAEQDSGEAQ